MTVLDPVVGPASHLALIAITQLGHRGAVRAQAVFGDRLWRTVALQSPLHKAQRRSFVPFPGDEGFQDLPFLIDRTPQLHHLTIQLHVHLIEMPAPVTKALHPVHPLAANVAGKQWSEPVPPEPHGLMSNVDPGLEQQVFGIAQRQRKPHIHHHHKADHLGR